MHEQQKDRETQDVKLEQSQNIKISPIKAYTLSKQSQSQSISVDQNQTKIKLSDNDPVQTNQNDNLQKSSNNNMDISDTLAGYNSIKSYPTKQTDFNNMRKEFKKMKQNLSSSKWGDDSYYENDGQIENTTVRNEGLYEMSRIDKQMNNKQEDSSNKGDNKSGQIYKSMRETVLEVERNNTIRMQKIKQQKKLQKKQTMMQQSLIEEERINTKKQEKNQKQAILDKLQSDNFYPAVNEILDEMQISYEHFVIVKRVNLLKKNVIKENILDPILAKNAHINFETLNNSLLLQLTRFLIHQIKIRSYILFITEWIWIVIMIIINSYRINHFQRDQIQTNTTISSEEELITGDTIPVLLFIQAFLWILCSIAFLVSVVKCRIPFSTFHLIFHVFEIIINVFTFSLGMAIVYNNKNSSAIPLHFSFGLLDFIFSISSLIFQKSVNARLQKFLVLMNQYSPKHFYNTCC